MPFILEFNDSSLKIRTGEELLVSTPVKMLSGFANPFNLVSKFSIPCFSVSETNFGKMSFKFESV